MDFFSWHLYSDDIEEYILHAAKAKELLIKYGFETAESILDEWNASKYDGMRGTHGAALNAAVFCALQRSSVDMAAYYDARANCSYCGIMESFPRLKPAKPYYSFKAFHRLYKLGHCVESSAEDGIQICAAANMEKGEYAVLYTAYGKEPCETKLQLTGLEGKVRITTYAVDEKHNLSAVKEEYGHGPDITLYNAADADTVTLVTVKKLF